MPTKGKIAYICSSCGTKHPKWTGQCNECGIWNSLSETKVAQSAKSVHGIDPTDNVPIDLSSIQVARVARMSTGSAEFDRVLGGGFVEGAVTLLGGEPGIGKSTLALQCAGSLSIADSVLYTTGEESLQQLALRAGRTKIESSNIKIIATSELESVLHFAKSTGPKLVVIDSIQTLFSTEQESAPGSISQVRACADRLVRFAKSTSTAILMIGHITKDGVLAGPKLLEHIVDTVLYFEGDADSRLRLVRAFKNRFGAVNEIGVFVMTDSGLRGVENPSSMLLSSDNTDKPGSVVLVAQEGSRPLLVELQALVDDTVLAAPRRLSIGLDGGRINMLLAVLSRHAGVNLGNRDVYVNVAGGIKLSETATDVAIALAVLSSHFDKPLPVGTVCFGEIGLSGEIRPVQRGQERLKEAKKLGFRQAIIPQANQAAHGPEKLEVVPVKNVGELLELLH